MQKRNKVEKILEQQAGTFTARERVKIELMDKELDIVHKLLTELYNYDNVLPLVKKALREIDELKK